MITLINPSQPPITVPPLLKLLINRRKRAIDAMYDEKFHELGILKGSKVTGYNLSLGLLQIASFIENEGYTVNYYQEDFLKNIDEWERSLNHAIDKSDVIAFTSTTPTYYESLRIKNAILKKSPNIITAIGGVHATFNWKECLSDGFDFVILGEGEKTFKDLLSKIEKRGDFSSVMGIAYKEENRLRLNKPNELLSPKEIPIPAYHLVDQDLLKISNPKLCTSIGCPYHCSFCTESVFWKKLRFKDIDCLLYEMEIIRDLFKANYLHLFDSTFNVSSSRIYDVTSALKKNFPDMFFSCNLRPNNLQKDVLKQLKNCNFIQVNIGIESGSDKVLGYMKKDITFNDMRTSLRKTREYINLIVTSWIIGHPGETHETATESLLNLKQLYVDDLIDDSTPRVYIPYPGTSEFKMRNKLGIEILENNWEKYARWNFPPVHQLKALDRYELYIYFLNMFALNISMKNKKYNVDDPFEQDEQLINFYKEDIIVFGRNDPS
jgi:radical SAM superfamily enzyme YgiQ (UPF0313 family)